MPESETTTNTGSSDTTTTVSDGSARPPAGGEEESAQTKEGATTSLASALSDNPPKTDEGEQAKDAEGKAKEAEGADDKSKDQGEDPVPEKYELSMPEGFELDAESFAEIEPLLRDSKIGNARAQELTDKMHSWAQRMVSKATEAAQEAVNQRGLEHEKQLSEALKADGYSDWNPESKDHPAKRDAVVGVMALMPARDADGKDLSSQARTEAAGKLLHQLDEVGAAALVLPLLARVGRAAASDKFALGDARGRPRTAAEILYGSNQN